MPLPFDPQVVSRFKAVAASLLGIVAAASGIWFIGFFGDYFEANPFLSPVMLTKALGIDILGAIVPAAAASISLVVFLKTAKTPLKKLTAAFCASVVLAFLICHITPDGLAGYPLLFALGSSILAAAVNAYPKPFNNLRKNLFFTGLLTLACVPLSLLLVDLAYAPRFYGGIIGGNGLTDGLLLSTLYAPLAVLGVFSALSYVPQMVLLIKQSTAPQQISKVKPDALPLQTQIAAAET